MGTIGRWASALSLLLLLTSAASAEQVSVIGAPGTPGVDGAPNAPGGPGGPGEDVDAAADSADPHNQVDATGGAGGSGGHAGLGTLPTDGGAGGRGGAAAGSASTATSDQDATAWVQANGGAGGEGGGPLRREGPGGAGGAASVAAIATSLSADASADARSEAGDGGDGQVAGHGGDADASASASGGGADSRLLAIGYATGGRGGVTLEGEFGTSPDGNGGNGGNAIAQAIAQSTTAGEVHAQSSARGGRGGNAEFRQLDGGDGGDATASAYATGHGAVRAFANAQGGGGGTPARGSGGVSGGAGATTATARGVSLGGGDVSVTAWQDAGGSVGGDGADSIAENIVSGSTAGGLTLEQRAMGGSGGSVDGVHRAGDARSVLDTRNEGGGGISISVDAIGGQGVRSNSFSPYRSGGNAVADARAHSDSGQGVEVNARAIGGAGGGTAQVTAFGSSSAGGDVTVSASAQGGVDGTGTDPTRLVDAVGGSTSGALNLFQSVFAGVGEGTHRDAETGLTRVDSLASFIFVALDALGSAFGSGGDARVLASSVESTGAALVRLSASANSNPGNTATIESLYAGSGSGDVFVQANLRSAADTQLDNVVDGDTSGALSLFQFAETNGGAGLDATSVLERHKSLEHLSLGSNASSLRGAALATTRGSNAAGGLSLNAVAEGNTGATASGSGEASGDVYIDVQARAAGPFGATSGPAEIEEARGVSTGGGLVSVRAGLSEGDAGSGGIGRSAELVNFVEGETTGALSLEQFTLGGSGGIGGSARSVLERSDSRSDLILINEAFGGSSEFGNNGADAEAISIAENDAGNATARARAVGGGGDAGGTARVTAKARALGDVEVFGEARAGGGNDVGSAVLTEVSGVSDGGGAVSVTGIQGEEAIVFGIGREVSLHNAIHGETTGLLSLRQVAEGGDSEVDSGGSARSVLTHTTASEALTLTAEALAGDSMLAGEGGSAKVELRSENTLGEASAIGLARGGAGARGGSVELFAEALGHSDGAAVTIGQATFDPAAPAWGAHAGDVRGSFPQPLLGGLALSESHGTSLADAEVSVFDWAVGGDGRRRESFGSTPPLPAGEGGAARSIAEAAGAGTSAVEANARARGGDGGVVRWYTDFGQPLGTIASAGGGADARSHASGLGEVHALADATAGLSLAESNGSASALASAEGASGDAEARAVGSLGGVSLLALETSALVDGGATAAACVDAGAGVASLAGLQGTGPDVSAGAALSSLHGGGEQTVAEVSFAATPGAGTGSQISASFEIDFDETDSLLAEDVELIFFDSQGTGTGLESLRLTALFGDEILLDETVLGLDAAIAFLNGLVIRPPAELDTLPSDDDVQLLPPSLRLALVWQSLVPDWSFTTQLRVAANVVPEPGTALLLTLGLMLLRARGAGRAAPRA